MWQLDGKTALVTGASGGLGQAIAKNLAQAGATVVLTGTRQAVLEEVAASLPKGDHKVITANLSEEAEATRLITDAGQLDILVNNAGITRDGLLMRQKEEDWQAVINTNLTACMRLAKASLKPMMKSRWGRIINITSIVGHMGNAGQSNYAAAKAGLAGFSKSLALEVASRGITVNCIAPGFIQTAMTDALNDAQKQAMLDHIPLGTFGQPDDVAAGVVYLASPAGGYVTGQTLHINGGMLLV